MDINDIVIYRSAEHRIVGFDPYGVTPRCVYLEDVRSGTRSTVPLADVCRQPGSHLRLVDGETDERR